MLISFSNKAQEVNLDSLWGVWRNSSISDSNRLNSIQRLLWDHYFKDKKYSDSIPIVIDLGINFSKPNTYWRAKMYNNYATFFQNKPNLALLYLDSSFNYFKNTGNKRHLNSLNSNKSVFLKKLKRYDEALRIQLSILNEDSLDLTAYANISNTYEALKKRDSAIYYTKKGISTFRYLDSNSKINNINDKTAYVNMLGNLASLNQKSSKYFKAIEIYEEAILFSNKINSKNQYFHYSRQLTQCLVNIGQYNKALSLTNNLYERSLEINDTNGICNSLFDLGNIYYYNDLLDSAMSNYYRALYLRKAQNNKLHVFECYFNLSGTYKSINIDSSLFYIEKAIELYPDKLNSRIQKLNILEYHNKIDFNVLNEIDKNIVKVNKINKSIAVFYYIKSKYLFQNKDFKKSFKYAEMSYDFFRKNNFPRQSLDCITLISDIFEKQKNYKSAFVFKKLEKKYSDSLSKISIRDEILNEFSKKEYSLMIYNDSIKHADEILIQQAQILAKEEQLNSETQKRNGLIIISLLILVSLGLVFIQLKKVREKNFIIEEKQQEITDSINYAKRLQQGILVPFDLVQSWLSESFILFKPKDIVSGDFYWIEKAGDKIYFAVADCTGHGIPGALVSIICSNALSKALYEDKITSPAKILDATREIVEKRFVRSSDNIKDGMDISLCCIDVKTKTVTWAGAMNPLWIIKKGSNKIEELKPDRQAIGFVEKPKLFTEHKVKLELNDLLYLFSDGYQDQFGGKNGKKYMKGKMKKFVLSIQDQDMQTQLSSFDKEFNTWKGSHEQIDDVCVMGVRIT